MGRELVRQFEYVDIVVSGEGEISFCEVVQSLLNGRSPDRIPGIYTRRNQMFSINSLQSVSPNSERMLSNRRPSISQTAMITFHN